MQNRSPVSTYADFIRPIREYERHMQKMVFPHVIDNTTGEAITNLSSDTPRQRWFQSFSIAFKQGKMHPIWFHTCEQRCDHCSLAWRLVSDHFSAGCHCTCSRWRGQVVRCGKGMKLKRFSTACCIWRWFHRVAQPPVFFSQEFQKLRERLPAKKRKAAAQVADIQRWKGMGFMGDRRNGSCRPSCGVCCKSNGL